MRPMEPSILIVTKDFFPGRSLMQSKSDVMAVLDQSPSQYDLVVSTSSLSLRL
jgi:hypothetical protein